MLPELKYILLWGTLELMEGKTVLLNNRTLCWYEEFTTCSGASPSYSAHKLCPSFLTANLLSWPREGDKVKLLHEIIVYLWMPPFLKLSSFFISVKQLRAIQFQLCCKFVHLLSILNEKKQTFDSKQFIWLFIHSIYLFIYLLFHWSHPRVCLVLSMI